jgi:hypothetical protein
MGSPPVERIDQYTKHLSGSVGVEFGELLVAKIKIAGEAIAAIHRDLESRTHDAPGEPLVHRLFDAAVTRLFQ